MKRAGGRRFYRRQDIDVLRGVRSLLHDEGYTIKGVQRLHKEQGMRRVLAAAGSAEPYVEPDIEPDREPDREPSPSALGGPDMARPLLGEHARRRLGSVLGDLEGVKARLDRLLSEGQES